MKKISQRHPEILFWLGILGILFYASSPILFPHVHEVRQPELLPVFTLMIGLGRALSKISSEDD